MSCLWQFWDRRNPNPGCPDNEAKEEHYHRMAYANEHFAAGLPGWKTDRGKIYIMHGPPDSIDAHPSGGTYDRPPEEGGGTTITSPFEIWRYRSLENVGQEVLIEFVDTCLCGDYHMTIDRSEKDLGKHTPGIGPSDDEASGRSNPGQRNYNGLEQLPSSRMSALQAGKQFERLGTYYAVNRPPAIKFHDLDEVVTHNVRYNLLPFDLRVDFIKVTADTVMVPVTVQLQNKDLVFAGKDGIQRATVNLSGRVSGMTGKVAAIFEDTVKVEVPEDLLKQTMTQSSVYWKAMNLRPGRYRLNLALKDVNGDRLGTWSKSIQVPEFPDDRLSASSLILADQLEKVSNKLIGGAAYFVIGDNKVRPRMATEGRALATFKRGEPVDVWLQVYDLAVDPKTHRPDATIEYDVVKLGGSETVAVQLTENTEELKTVGNQLTLTKSLAPLEPGSYEVRIKVVDKIAEKSLVPVPAARFAVE